MADTVNLASSPTLFPPFAQLPAAISNLATPTLTGATPTADQATALSNARGLVAPFNQDQQDAFSGTRSIAGYGGYDANYDAGTGLAAGASQPGQGYTAGLSTIGGVQAGAGTALANAGNWGVGQGQQLYGAGLGAASTAATDVAGTAATLGQAGTNLLNGQYGLDSQYTNPMQLQGVQPQQWNDQTAQQYMSPYMNSVMQSGLANLKNQEDMQSGQELARQAGLGSFTDRSAIYNAQLQKNFADTNAGFISNAMNSAYNTGMQGYLGANQLGVQAGLGNNSQALQAQGLGLQGATADMQAKLAQAGLGINALGQTGQLQSGLVGSGLSAMNSGIGLIGQGGSQIGNAGQLDLSGASLGINADVANRGLLNSTAATLGNLATGRQASDQSRVAGLAGIGQQQQAQQQTLNTAPQTLANWGAGIVAGVPYGSNRQVPAVSNTQLGLAGASMIPSLVNAGTGLYNTFTNSGNGNFSSALDRGSLTDSSGNVVSGNSNTGDFTNGIDWTQYDAAGGLISDHTNDPRLRRAFGGLSGGIPSVRGIGSPGAAVSGLAGAAAAPGLHDSFMHNLRKRLAVAVAPKMRFAQGGLAHRSIDAMVAEFTPDHRRMAPKPGLARHFDLGGGFNVNLDQQLDSPWSVPGAPRAGLAAPGVSVGPTMAAAPQGAPAPAAAPSTVAAQVAGLATPPVTDAPARAEEGPFPRGFAESAAAFGAGLASAPLRFGGAGAAIQGYLGAQRYARQEERQDEQMKAQAQAAKLKAQETALGMVKTQADIDKENRAAKNDEASRAQLEEYARTLEATDPDKAKIVRAGGKDAMKEIAKVEFGKDADKWEFRTDIPAGASSVVAGWVNKRTQEVKTSGPERVIGQPSTNVNLNLDTSLNKIAGDMISEMRTKEYVPAVEAQQSVKLMQGALDKGLKTGLLAPGKLLAAKVVSEVTGSPAAGNSFFNTADAKQFESSSQEFTRSIIKSFGSNPSNSDLKFAEKMTASIRDQPEAAQRWLDIWNKRLQWKIDKYEHVQSRTFGPDKVHPLAAETEFTRQNPGPEFGNMGRDSGTAAPPPAGGAPAPALKPLAAPAPVAPAARQQLIENAKVAIGSGAKPADVLQRLKTMGVMDARIEDLQ